MRMEGDAKIFQSSAMGSLIRTIIGIALIGLGGVAIAGGVLPDKKPKKRTAKPTERLSSGQRVRFVVFGGAMGFAGLFLAGASLCFPSKLLSLFIRTVSQWHRTIRKPVAGKS